MVSIILHNQNRRTINGTAQNDVITLTGQGTRVVVNAGAGNDIIQAGTWNYGQYGTGPGIYTYSTVNGGAGNDGIYGFGYGCVLRGEAGFDTIVLNKRSDYTQAYGGEDNDILRITNAPTSYALLSGDLGNDTLVNAAGNRFTTLLGGAGDDTVTVRGFKDLANGGDGQDVMAVSGNNCELYGGVGNDTMRVDGGADSVLSGDLGNDNLNDGGFRTRLLGGEGDDVLTARNVGSVVTGGAGSDLFAANGAAFGRASALVLTDFLTGTDKVQLSTDDPLAANGYSEVQVAGDLGAALQAAQISGTDYTFVAGTSDGFLVYNNGNGGFSGVRLAGANDLADFAVGDIQTG